MKPSLLLASQSPRRRKILKFIGVDFRVVKPLGVVEKRKRGEPPRDLVRRLAQEKARSVSAKFPGHFVLGADTVVFSRGRIFGKPQNRRQAAAMLMRLQGGPHEVWTGVALAVPGDKRIRTRVEKTKVYFKPFSLKSIADYLNSAEPYDKAGAYNIEGTGRTWVLKWEGDYFNIVGLPIRPVLEMLKNI